MTGFSTILVNDGYETTNCSLVLIVPHGLPTCPISNCPATLLDVTQGTLCIPVTLNGTKLDDVTCDRTFTLDCTICTYV